MTISRVSGAPVAAASAATTQSLTIPSGTQGGDTIFVAHTYNPATGTTSTPSGYTQIATLDNGTTMRFVLWSKTAPGSLGVTSSDAGTTLTMTNIASQRMASVCEVYRGVSGVNAQGSLAEASSTTTHANATCVSTAAGIGISFFAERSASTPSTTVAVPGGWQRWNQAFGTGSATAATAAGDRQTVVASGTTIGSGNWTADVANQLVVMHTLALTPALPVIDAGPTQSVSPGATVTLAATEISVGTVSARGWTQLSGPTVTLSGASTATATFTAGSSDVYVFQYSVTDDSGTSTDNVQINVTSTTPRPVAVISSGSWTASGGSTLATVLADESDTTLALSEANPTGASPADVFEVRMSPPVAGQLSVTYNGASNGATPTLTVTVDLRQGSTTIATWTDTLTTSVQTFTHTLTTGQMSSITDSSSLSMRFTTST